MWTAASYDFCGRLGDAEGRREIVDANLKQVVNNTSPILFFAAVAGAPLPFGSTDPASVALWCVVLGAALLVADLRPLDRRHLLLLGLAAIPLSAYGIVLHEQLALKPWFSVAEPLWSEASDLLGSPVQPSVSIVRGQPFFSLGAPLAAMLSLICGLVIGADRDRARQLLQVIAWSGAAYALYGIVAHLIDPTHVLWREKRIYHSVLTSTFIGRNTAAVYFGSCSVIWLLLLFQTIRRELPANGGTWRDMLDVVAQPKRDVVIGFCLFVLCLSAMFMTRSRAGSVLSLLVLVLAFTAYFRRRLAARNQVVAALIAAAGLAVILMQVMGSGVGNRFDIDGFDTGGRLETYRSTLRMIADHPWLGTGQGTFSWGYPAYRSTGTSLWGVWDKAHSTPLETAAELGLPMAAMLAAAWSVILGILVYGTVRRRRMLAIPVAALCVAVLALLHSSVDFSLQIPGYTIVVMALIGTGLARSLAPRANSGGEMGRNKAVQGTTDRARCGHGHSL